MEEVKMLKMVMEMWKGIENGRVYLLGSQNGCDIMTIVGGSDSQGFTVTINSKEKELMYELTAPAIAEYVSALMTV